MACVGTIDMDVFGRPQVRLPFAVYLGAFPKSISLRRRSTRRLDTHYFTQIFFTCARSSAVYTFVLRSGEYDVIGVEPVLGEEQLIDVGAYVEQSVANDEHDVLEVDVAAAIFGQTIDNVRTFLLTRRQCRRRRWETSGRRRTAFFRRRRATRGRTGQQVLLRSLA